VPRLLHRGAVRIDTRRKRSVEEPAAEEVADMVSGSYVDGAAWGHEVSDDRGPMAHGEHPAHSPFAPALVLPRAGEGSTGPTVGSALSTPFLEAMAVDGDGALPAEAMEALLAEFEDEEFDEALEALADDAAARHLRANGAWSGEAPVPLRDGASAQLWMEGVTAAAERLMDDLEAHFGDQPAASVNLAEIDAVAAPAMAAGLGAGGPGDAQDQFLGALVNKVKKVAQGVAKVAKKGLAMVGRFLPMAVLMRALRRLVRPLLANVLRRAIGRLPAPLRPLATRLAGRFTGESEGSADEASPEEPAAETFDRRLAEFVLEADQVPGDPMGEAQAETPVGATDGSGPVHDLDMARARLVDDLTDAAPGEPPTAQMEGFVPAVMAALPVLRMGIRIAGRDRVIAIVARALANLIKGMVGPQAAQSLSRHIASVGLQLIGLEAENGAEPGARGSTLGMEALVAAAEDTVREVVSLPAESLADELLVEAEVQDAFARAVSRHLPSTLLRPELAQRESADEEAVWVMMPRTTRPCFRYKKYSRIIPVRITRPAARWVRMSGGDTLERRLLDAGVATWPMTGELELYELLAGAQLGHIAAYEAEPALDVATAAAEFELLDEAAAALLAGTPNLAATGRHGRPGPRGQAGTRYYRLRVPGAALRRRRLFALRLDLTSVRPVLTVNLWMSERDAHALAAHVEGRRMVQIISLVRGLVGRGFRHALAGRLERVLGRRGMTLPAGAAPRLADRLADAMVRAVSQQLPAAGPSLAQAARDPSPGVTLIFTFTFAAKAALDRADVGSPTLTIRPGYFRG
jgi:hypothetical protein